MVGTVEELRAAVSRLTAGESVRLCLRAGAFPLDAALVFEGLGHVIVVGTGPQTVVSVAETEADRKPRILRAFEDHCRSTIADDRIPGMATR